MLLTIAACSLPGNESTSPESEPTHDETAGQETALQEESGTVTKEESRVAPEEEEHTAPEDETPVLPQITEPDKRFSYFINRDGIHRRASVTLAETKIASDIYANLLVSGDYLYFTENDSIYEMNESGEIRRIFNQNFFNIFAHDNFLFFNNANGVFRFDLTTDSYVNLYSGQCRGLALTSDYIFFTRHVHFDRDDYHEEDPTPPQGELWRMDLDGENAIFVDSLVSYLSVHSGYIYYRDDRYDFGLYRLDPTTLEKTQIYSGYSFIESPCFAENSAFFVHNRLLVELNLETGEASILNDMGAVSSPRILDGYIYFLLFSGNFEGNRLCRIRLADREFEEVVRL